MSEPTGVIHDIGYKRYTGERLGRGYAVRSLYVHSLRTCFALGRTGGAKAFPWVIVGLLMVVAAVLTAVRTQTPGAPMPLSYWDFDHNLVILLIIFCATVAPELVSRDLRGGVLPLYFSRPIQRTDYALAKYGALATALFLVLAGPQLVMFVGGAFTLPDIADLPEEALNFGQGLETSAIYAVLFGALSLLAASLAGRRAVATALVVAVFIITTPVYGVLLGISSAGVESGWGEDLSQLAALASPMATVITLTTWWFDPGSTAVVDPGPYGPVYAVVAFGLIVVSFLLLQLRYRRVAR